MENINPIYCPVCGYMMKILGYDSHYWFLLCGKCGNEHLVEKEK